MGEEGCYIIPITTLPPPERLTCIKMNIDERRFNVSLILRDKVTRQCPQTTRFEEKGEPKRIRTEVPLLTSLAARPNRFTEGLVDRGGLHTGSVMKRDVHSRTSRREKDV